MLRAVLLLSVLMIGLPNYALAIDIDDCQSNVSKLLRAARDADGSASNFDEDDYMDEVEGLHEALDEIENRLRRAKSSCEYKSQAQRMCSNFWSIARLTGFDSAKKQCKSIVGASPGFCEACLGK